MHSKLKAWIDKIILSLDNLILNIDKYSEEDIRKLLSNNFHVIGLISSILDKKTTLEGHFFKK